ncbi:lysozyme [Streptomyces sp. NPDC091377]|uniref:lysozyme n=1 Tax=Streptomyces sp. NPDC091377 TaxID=3365995 RepID=UPI0037F8B665
MIHSPGPATVPARRRPSRLALSVMALTLGAVGLLEAPARAAGGGAGARGPQGHDVSSYQKDVDWRASRAKGARFVYVKATEATGYRNPHFGRQYRGAREAGLIRGAYHFARPDRSPGREQAAHFVRNGGGWRADGRTLPPALDIEHNPYDRKRPCYGLSPARTTGWIRSFSDEVARLTGRRPVIYTTAHWWNTCTGGSTAFAADHPLWVARYGSASAGTLPAGWSYWTIWQYADRGRLPGDQNLFNGSMDRLKAFAAGPRR